MRLSQRNRTDPGQRAGQNRAEPTRATSPNKPPPAVARRPWPEKVGERLPGDWCLSRRAGVGLDVCVSVHRRRAPYFTKPYSDGTLLNFSAEDPAIPRQRPRHDEVDFGMAVGSSRTRRGFAPDVSASTRVTGTAE